MIEHVIKNCLNPSCGRREIHHKQMSRNPHGTGTKVTLTCILCRYKEIHILEDIPYPKPKGFNDIA